MAYQIEYTGDAPEQNYQPQPVMPAGPVYQVAPRKRFTIPAILKTSAAFVLGAATLFSAEMWGPDWLRPSTPMGIYEASVEARVAEAESRMMAPYQAWAIEVQAEANQRIELYKIKSQGFLAAYQAGVDRAKIYAQMTGNLQSQLVASQLARTSGEQSGEVGLISLGRMFGGIANALEPGAGDDLYKWSSDNSRRLSGEINDAVIKGQRVTIDGWDAGLPDVAKLQSQLDSIEPLKLPPLPQPAPAPTKR